MKVTVKLPGAPGDLADAAGKYLPNSRCPKKLPPRMRCPVAERFGGLFGEPIADAWEPVGLNMIYCGKVELARFSALFR